MSAQPSENPPPRPVEQGPLPLFDLHLRVLSDSYLNFFQERKKIEEAYYESLLRLHDKSERVDVFYDERLASTTLRATWSQVRDNLEREAQARRAFLEVVSNEVINPLIALRETQDRIRKRIREDMKDSVQAHADYAENVLPKLKRAYLRKCQDVEDYKAAATAAAAAAAQTPRASLDSSTTLSSVRSNPPPPPARPVVTAPQPLRPLDRRPSLTSTRARSPSTNGAFSDLAQHGKKQLNQLMTFLDKGGPKEMGGRGGHDALRSVRAKREADEADTLYRNSVHWLETLRIRREKIIEAGYHSLETFLRESSETVKITSTKYTDILTATFTTSAQICGHARMQLDMVSTTRDMANVSNYISHALAASLPKPTLYYNFFVGECRDLIFGFSLLDYATARNLPDGEIPKIVHQCIEEIDKRGLELEGLYRVSGRLAYVVELMRKIERNEQAFSFNPLTDDVYVIATLLKMYIRDLPEPLFRFPLQERIQHSEEIKKHLADDFQVLRSKIRRLPPIHRATLKAVALHLNRVASNRDKNKMDVKNLAIVFGIFGSEDELPKGGDLLSIQTNNDTLMIDLITHARTLFDDRHPGTSSPPLPPAPTDEPVPPVSYGTQHTKVAELAPDDFTPRMPNQPPPSIHPSSRANTAVGQTLPNRLENNNPLPPPVPLRPGRLGAASPQSQALKGTHGLDFEPIQNQETDSVDSSEQTSQSGTAPTTPTSAPGTPLLPHPSPSSFHEPVDTDDEDGVMVPRDTDKEKPEKPPRPVSKDIST